MSLREHDWGFTAAVLFLAAVSLRVEWKRLRVLVLGFGTITFLGALASSSRCRRRPSSAVYTGAVRLACTSASSVSSQSMWAASERRSRIWGPRVLEK